MFASFQISNNANIGCAQNKRQSSSSSMAKANAKEREATNSTSTITGRKGQGGSQSTSQMDQSNTSAGGMARKNDNGFDIESLPCCRLLSIKEKKLCSLLRLRPTHYVTLKTLILKV